MLAKVPGLLPGLLDGSIPSPVLFLAMRSLPSLLALERMQATEAGRLGQALCWGDAQALRDAQHDLHDAFPHAESRRPR